MSDINGRIMPFKKESLEMQVKREKESTVKHSIRLKSLDYANNLANFNNIFNDHNTVNNASYMQNMQNKELMLPPINHSIYM